MIVNHRLCKIFNAGSADEMIALNEVNLTVGEHEFVTVIGTNGSGKSTLLNAIAGNIVPDAGRIKINGSEVTAKADFQRAKYISRVFQNPFSGTAPGMTIAENLLMAYNRGRHSYPVINLNAKLRDYFREQLAILDMNLENRLETIMGSLSGGQRQAITLLMAVLRPPMVLLLDEHTAALDPKSANQIIKLTRRFIKEYRLTTLMVTHSMQQALELGTRTIMMHHGQIIEDIPEEEKKILTTEDLLCKFEDIRKTEKLTPEMIEILKNQYA